MVLIMYTAVFATRFEFFSLFSSGQPSSWGMLEKSLGRMQLLPLPLLKSPQRCLHSALEEESHFD